MPVRGQGRLRRRPPTRDAQASRRGNGLANAGRKDEAADRGGRDLDHLSCELTLVNVVLRVVPTALTAATIPIEIPAASKQYSIAVAPELSLIKRTIADMRYLSPGAADTQIYGRPS